MVDVKRGQPGHTAVTVPRRSRYNWNGHRAKLATSTVTVNPISTCAAGTAVQPSCADRFPFLDERGSPRCKNRDGVG